MKAITLTQPWATLVVLGFKCVETRSWQTKHRGPLAIHAAKGFPKWARELCETEPFRTALSDLPVSMCNPGENSHERDSLPALWQCLPVGCIVAVCDLVDIYPTEEVFAQTCWPPKPPYRQSGKLFMNADEWRFGDYNPNRFAWKLENIRLLAEPIPAKGALSLWEWEGA